MVIFQPAITCSKLTIETLEKVVKYVKSYSSTCSSVSIVNFEQENAAWSSFIFLLRLEF